MALSFSGSIRKHGIFNRLVLVPAILGSALSVFGQSSYTPPTYTPPVYNQPASTWNPGSNMPPQTQNPYVVDLAKAASRYTPPNPYVQPTPQQTQWYINNHPALWNLPQNVKSQIANGAPGVLSGSYLPNGTPNPFYSNGRTTPNWYLPSTWSPTGTSWQGVQPNGFMPPSTSHVYNPSVPSNSYSSFRSDIQSSTPARPAFNSNVPPPPSQPSRTSEASANRDQIPPAIPRPQTPNFNPVRSGSGTGTADVARAIESGRRSLALSESAGDKVGQVTNHAALAELFIQHGELDRAREHAGLAERIADRPADPGLQVTLLRTQAAIFMASGEFEKAIEQYQKMAATLSAVGNQSEKAAAQTSLGWAYQSIGDIPRALAAYEDARKLFAKLGNHEGETRVAIGMGSLYQSMGDSAKASEIYMQVLPLATPEQFARMLVSVAEIYAAAGLPRDALERYEKALKLENVDFDSPLGVSVLTGIGRCHTAMGRYTTARFYFDKAEIKAEEIGDRRLKAGVLASIGELHYWMAIAESAELKYTSFGFVDTAAAGKNFFAALQSYRESLELTRAAGDRLGEIGILTNTGLAYDAWGKQHQALDYYLAALEKLEGLQTGARIEEFRISLADQSARLYQRAIELAVSRHRMEEAFNLTERSRARAFLDQMGNDRIDLYKDAPKDYLQESALRGQNIALQRQLGQEVSRPEAELNYERIKSLQEQISRVQQQYQEDLVALKLANPAYASFLSVTPLTLSEIQKKLTPDTTVVAYYTMPEETLAFVTSDRSLHVVRIPVKSGQLAGAVLRLHDFSGPDSELILLKYLYAALIAPVQSQLKTTKLIFVPHGALNDLSFAALTPDGSTYLSDSFTISYLPSAGVLPYLKAKSERDTRMVVMANDQEDGAPQLNHAYEEARAVASLGTATLLLGNDATASALEAMASENEIIHLVGHVYLDRDHPEFSRISVGQPLERDGALDLNSVLKLNLKKTSLVVLSGCRTQTGRRSRGDDAVALNRAFLYAGAASVIASLWSVDDDATRELMVAFYTHLKEGSDKARALRMAQMDVRRKYPDPYYWAAFVLTGDPGESGSSSLMAGSGVQGRRP